MTKTTHAGTTGTDPVQVELKLLDRLMDLAGELVLTRNQLLQSIENENMDGISVSGQRIDLITTDLQETIMKTRNLPNAIIPCQVIGLEKERYALPQDNLMELLRIPADRVKETVKQVSNAWVVQLRGELLPLVDLAGLINKKTGEAASSLAAPETETLKIAVVSTGNTKYGMVVHDFFDSEEIVVKPMGRHLASFGNYAGATIMGDGKVSLILDIEGIAESAGVLGQKTDTGQADVRESSGEKTALLVFRNLDTEYLALPLDLVQRIEKIRSRDLERIGSQTLIQYRGGSLRVYEPSDVLALPPLPDAENREVIVLSPGSGEMGLMVTGPVDTVEVVPDICDTALKQPGVSGSMTINNKTTLIMDMAEFERLVTDQ